MLSYCHYAVLDYDRLSLPRAPACIAAVLAYNGTEPVDLGNRLFALPLGTLLA